MGNRVISEKTVAEVKWLSRNKEFIRREGIASYYGVSKQSVTQWKHNRFHEEVEEQKPSKEVIQEVAEESKKFGYDISVEEVKYLKWLTGRISEFRFRGREVADYFDVPLHLVHNVNKTYCIFDAKKPPNDVLGEIKNHYVNNIRNQNDHRKATSHSKKVARSG